MAVAAKFAAFALFSVAGGGCAWFSPCPVAIHFAPPGQGYDLEIPFHEDVPGVSVSFVRLECDRSSHPAEACAWKRSTVWAIFDGAGLPNPLRFKYGVLPDGMRLSGPDPKEAMPLREGDVVEVFATGPLRGRVGHNCRVVSAYSVFRGGGFDSVDEPTARRAAHRSP
jgi:hypothetical protein